MNREVRLLWTARAAPAPDLWRRLPPWKTRQLLCCRSADARRQSLLAWALLESVLGGALGRVESTALGKPFLPGGPFFSLSHCEGLAVAAFAPAPIGVDAEPMGAAGGEAAIRRWTARESYGKCRGVGPTAQPGPDGDLWSGTLCGAFAVSVCVLQGAARPKEIVEWNGEARCRSIKPWASL